MPQRLPLFIGLLAAVLLPTVRPAAAREPCTVSDEPEWNGTTLKTECSDGQTFDGYLQGSVCGGFDRDRSVVGDKKDDPQGREDQRDDLLLGGESYIAKVTGVPGREGFPLGQYEYGMAVRMETGGRYDDGFQFPDTTTGFSTTCAPGYPDTTKWVFTCRDPRRNGRPGCPGEREDKEMGYPYFQDPACRWRLTGGRTVDPPKYDVGDFEEIDGGEDPAGQTPGLCEDMRNYLNDWQYTDCLESHWDFDEEVSVCDCWGARYICNDHPVPGSERGTCSNFDHFPNAQDCTGEECRCSGSQREDQCVRTTWPPDWVGPPDLPYRSYYRRYAASVERKKLDLAQDDRNAVDDIPIACYGFYNEFDPKTRATSAADFRCVIDIDTADRKDTQKGKGAFSAPLPDVPPPAADAFDQETDSWWQLLGGGFSLLSPKEENLSLALANFAPALVQGVPQTQGDDAKDGWALNALSRDVDDTGPLGTVTRWWHRQQTAGSTLFTPPTLRLAHVPAWAMGLDGNAALFGGASSSVDMQWTGFREQPIDNQIHAHEDLIGDVLRFIHRSLFAVEETPLPVAVPMGEPGEFRARSQALCSWYVGTHPGTRECADVRGRTREIMDALEQYANRIEEVRALRNQLTILAGDLLTSHKDVLEPLYAWSTQNLETYETFLRERGEVLALKGQWEDVQRQFQELHEKTNAPWCMNQRFTTAIYSLLDPWMTTRPANTEYAGNPPLPGWDPDVVGGDGGGIVWSVDLPSFDRLGVRPQSDIVMDLSVFQSIRVPLTLPVLKPQQIQLDLNRYLPPTGKDESALPEPPPALPDMNAILTTVRQAREALPVLCGPGSDACPAAQMALQAQKPTYWTAEERAAIGAMMDDIGQVVGGMNQAYKDFWESLNPDDDRKKEEEKDGLKCRNWRDGVCMHVEMDLLERLTRIASRPAVLLAEDYRARGTLRSFAGVCLPDDDACQLLNPETTYPRAGWQMTQGASAARDPAAATEARLNGVRAALRNMTLPEPIGSVSVEALPPYAVRPSELLQIFDIPRPIDLTPTP